MIGYQAYDWRETRRASIVGVLAILIAVFPKDGWTGAGIEDQCPGGDCDDAIKGGETGTLIFGLDLAQWGDLVHSLASRLMFSLLAFFFYYVFTRELFSGHAELPAKKWRNCVYRWCGRIIALCVLSLGVFTFLESKWVGIPPVWDCWNIFFFIEATALWAFGFSWLVKSKLLGRRWTDDPADIQAGFAREIKQSAA